MDYLSYRDHLQKRYELVEELRQATELRPAVAIAWDHAELLPDGTLILHPGYCWDGPSGPTIATPDAMRGSAVHDALYNFMRHGLLPQSAKLAADKLLRQLCIEDGMDHFRAEYWFLGVQQFGASSCAVVNSTEPDDIIVRLPIPLPTDGTAAVEQKRDR